MISIILMVINGTFENVAISAIGFEIHFCRQTKFVTQDLSGIQNKKKFFTFSDNRQDYFIILIPKKSVKYFHL